MEKSNVYVYVFDRFPDYQVALALTEIRQSEKYAVYTVSENLDFVISASGMNIKPDLVWDEVRFDKAAMMILPGGAYWENYKITEKLKTKLNEFKNNNVQVAAICGAVYCLAQAEWLNDSEHTGNTLQYLKKFGGERYCGELNFVNLPCVVSKKFITANGTAQIDFAYEIIKSLGIFPPNMLQEWLRVFKYGIIE